MPERSEAVFRNAIPEDLDAILDVEQSWGEEGRADGEKFVSRMRRFPQGFFVGCLHIDGVEKIVATVTAMPLKLDLSHGGGFRSWDAVTNDGYLFSEVNLASCNALYIVSGVIDSGHRGHNIFQLGVTAQIQLAQALGLRYVAAGAVLPGYKRYCEKNGQTDAYAYCIARRGKHLVDPLLDMYEDLGFVVRAPYYVVPEYFSDDASKNYAAVVVRDLLDTPL